MRRIHKRTKKPAITNPARYAVAGIIMAGIIAGLAYRASFPRTTKQTTSELATNGSFETSPDGVTPDGWSWTGSRLTNKEGWRCGAGAYDGNCWFLIDGNKKPGYMTQTITTTGSAGDRITVRAASRPTQVTGDYSALFTISYYDGSVTNTYALTFSAGTSTAYQVNSTQFTASAPYSSIRVILPFDQTQGSVDYDGISVTRQ